MSLEHGKLLCEPYTLPNGKIVKAVEVGVGDFGTTFPRFVVEFDGEGDFGRGLVEVTRRIVRVVEEVVKQ